MVIAGLFYFLSLQYLTAELCSVIFFAHPVIVALLALVVSQEKMVPRLLLCNYILFFYPLYKIF